VAIYLGCGGLLRTGAAGSCAPPHVLVSWADAIGRDNRQWHLEKELHKSIGRSGIRVFRPATRISSILARLAGPCVSHDNTSDSWVGRRMKEERARKPFSTFWWRRPSFVFDPIKPFKTYGLCRSNPSRAAQAIPDWSRTKTSSHSSRMVAMGSETGQDNDVPGYRVWVDEFRWPLVW